MPVPRGFSHGEEVANSIRSQHRFSHSSEQGGAKTLRSRILSWSSELAKFGRKHGRAHSEGHVDKSWLQEAEDERWMDVEGGSPKRWKSCSFCAFLNSALQPYCEGCGTQLSSERESCKDQDILRCMAHADIPDEAATIVVGVVAEEKRINDSDVIDGIVVDNSIMDSTALDYQRRGFHKSDAYTDRVLRSSRCRGYPGKQVDGDDCEDSACEAECLQVSVVQHNNACPTRRRDRILQLFNLLDSSDSRRLGRDALRMFLKLRGSHTVVGSSWPLVYRTLSSQYGWDAKGVNFMQFVHFVDDQDSCGHCSETKLQTVLAELRVSSMSQERDYEKDSDELDRVAEEASNEDNDELDHFAEEHLLDKGFSEHGVDDGDDLERVAEADSDEETDESDDSDEDDLFDKLEEARRISTENGSDEGGKQDCAAEEDSDEDSDEVDDIAEEDLRDNLEQAPPVGTLVEILCAGGWSSARVVEACGERMKVRFQPTLAHAQEDEDDLTCSEHCIRLLRAKEMPEAEDDDEEECTSSDNDILVSEEELKEESDDNHW